MGRQCIPSSSLHTVPACLSSNPGNEQRTNTNLVRTLTAPAQFFNILRLGKHDTTPVVIPKCFQKISECHILSGMPHSDTIHIIPQFPITVRVEVPSLPAST